VNQPLEQQVHEALDNAKDSGYTVFLAGSAYEIACDMIDCSDQFEDHLPDTLVPFVQSWQSKQGATS
jgi:hypothetical protein